MRPESSTTPAYCSAPHLESQPAAAEVEEAAVAVAGVLEAAVAAEVPTAAPCGVGQR